MNPNNLLDQILLILQSIKDNPEQLKKLHQFMLDELYTGEEPGSEAIVIPGRYASLVKDTADRLSAGLVCYINPGTLEIIDIPQAIADNMMFEEDEKIEENEDNHSYADMKRIHRDWEQTITLSPPESNESFSFMKQFWIRCPEVASARSCRKLYPGESLSAILTASSINQMKGKPGLLFVKNASKIM